MKLLLTLGLAAGSAAAVAQTPITITRAQFPATASSVDLYQPFALTGVTNPATGANRAWDYRNVVAQGQLVTDNYNAVGANPPFAGSVRTYDLGWGSLAVPATAYEGFNADGFGQLGTTIVTPQSYPLTAATGGANDVIAYPAQTITEQTLRIPLPMTSTTRVVRTHRIRTNTVLTIQSQNINQAAFVGIQRVTTIDSVAGWGTLRIPVAGSTAGSAAIPVLLERRRVIMQDSFYLNNQPAPAALLTGLGLVQGDTYADYRYRFFRQNSGQPMLTFIYDDNTFAAAVVAAYSTEQSIALNARAAREVAGGLVAWPNPAAASKPLQFTLGTSSLGQALKISLRDATGRVVAQLNGINGQPVTLPLLPAGLYLAEAEGANGSRASRRITLE